MYVRTCVCTYVRTYVHMQNELVSLQSENSSLNGKLTKLGQVCQVSHTVLVVLASWLACVTAGAFFLSFRG